MDDLISRQRLLEYIHGEPVGRLLCDKYNLDGLIEQLPPAQPEIIRCKDCKHRDPEDKKCDCGHDIEWQLPRQDDWFCADAER
jgi:hypothetical protein